MSKVQAAKTIIGALESGVKLCTHEGRQIAKGVRLARPGINHTIATIETKNGTKVVETVKKNANTFYGGQRGGKWQEITEPNGTVTTIWRKPIYDSGVQRGRQYGWRKESPNGVVEAFRYGGDDIGMSYANPYCRDYPKELSYMLRDNEGRSLIAIKDANGLTIRAKDIELENGLKLNGHYHTSLPGGSFERMVGGNARAPEGTDKGILYELFTTVDKFLEGLRKPAV